MQGTCMQCTMTPNRYSRKYNVHQLSTLGISKIDEETRVVIRQHPDANGNVNSPLASVFEIGSFIGALTELAITAETVRSRPRLVTQQSKKDTNAVDPSSLFFDSESMDVYNSGERDGNVDATRALQMQQSMCSIINKLQTTNKKSEAGNKAMPSHVPEEASPSIFVLPKDHEMAPNVSSVDSRQDLEPLYRLSMEQFCAAFGVPSDLLFSGKYSSKTSNLSLLNATVMDLAECIDRVLTLAYRDIYSDCNESNIGELHLLTSPLSSIDDVVSLFQAGLVPIEIAMPSVLHTIWIDKESIQLAVENAKKEQLENKKVKDNKKLAIGHERGDIDEKEDRDNTEEQAETVVI